MSITPSLAFKNLRRNRRRNVATAISICSGCVGLIVAFGYILKAQSVAKMQAVYQSRHGDLTIYQASGLENHIVHPRDGLLNESEQNIILQVLASHSEVNAVGRSYEGMGLISNGCQTSPFMVNAQEPAIEKKISALIPKNFSDESIQKDQRELPYWSYPTNLGAIAITRRLGFLIGKQDAVWLPGAAMKPSPAKIDCLSRDKDQKIAKDPTVQLIASSVGGNFSAVDAVITQHFLTASSFEEDVALRAPLDLIQRLFETKGVTSISVFFSDAFDTSDFSALSRFAKMISSELTAHGVHTDIYLYNDPRINPGFAALDGFSHLLALFFSSIVLVVAILTVINALSMTVRERKAEIGALRALGFRTITIAWLFSLETFFLSALSAAISMLIGFGLIRWINAEHIHFKVPGMAGEQILMLVSSMSVDTILFILMIIVATLTSFITCFVWMQKPITRLLGVRA